jgi:four helix bundle protein
MSTIKRFEDLECWSVGRTSKREVYRLTRNPEFTKDYPRISQIQPASFSVTANIVEGSERNGNREFIHFLAIANGSTGETRDHRNTALDENYISQEEFRQAHAIAESVGRLIGGFINYLQPSNVAGTKFVASPTRNPNPKARNSKL